MPSPRRWRRFAIASTLSEMVAAWLRNLSHLEESRFQAIDTSATGTMRAYAKRSEVLGSGRRGVLVLIEPQARTAIVVVVVIVFVIDVMRHGSASRESARGAIDHDTDIDTDTDTNNDNDNDKDNDNDNDNEDLDSSARISRLKQAI